MDVTNAKHLNLQIMKISLPKIYITKNYFPKEFKEW
jgi:hypothetical protein